ncbi:MAG: sugar phosphate isomerase/epimerase [Methanomicrobiaceae archaeon]|nr:sugar phosphate isomerase/epimerase [Methanomicrobiaceae archaeon]
MTLEAYFSSSSSVWDSIEWVFGIEDCGYAGWEISADGNYRLDRPDNMVRIRDVLESTGLGVTVHAPYADLNLASLNYPIYRESIRQICQCITHAADLTDRVTIHPGYMSPAGKLVPETVWRYQKEALAEIGACAADTGVLVCLENMIAIREFLCREPGELFGMTDGIEGIGVTLDIGHANTVGAVDAFLQDLSRVDHMHLHDNHGIHDEHLPLGDGTIDWPDVGRRVKEQYSGICVVEGRNLTEGAHSLAAFTRWFV